MALPSLKYFCRGGQQCRQRLFILPIVNSLKHAVLGCLAVPKPLVTLGYQGEANADLAATTDGETWIMKLDC